MKGLKTVVAAMFAATLLVGCSEDQTAFNVEEIPGRCTIKGEIVYNLGTTYEDGKFVYNYQPVANTPVYVTVANNEYSDGLAGNSTFETVTDENGNYTIEIPAANNKMSVKVTTPDFELEKSVVVLENNKVVTKTQNAVYRANSTINDVHANGIVLQNILCTECNAENYFQNYSADVTLKGTIGKNSEYVENGKPTYSNTNVVNGHTDATLYKCWVPAAKVDMILTINGYSYNLTTDNNGQYTLQVPVDMIPATVTYSIQTVNYDSDFTHYEAFTDKYTVGTRTYNFINYRAHTLKGYYESTSATLSTSFPVASVVVDQKSKLLKFYPFDNGQDLFNYSAGSFTNSDSWLSDILDSLKNNNTTK